MKELEKLMAAQAAFEHNDKAEVLHVTEDGTCFPVRNDANNHAVTTKTSVRNIITVERAKVEAMIQALSSGKPSDEESTKDKVKRILACQTAQELTDITIGNDEPDTVKDAFDTMRKRLKVTDKRS